MISGVRVSLSAALLAAGGVAFAAAFVSASCRAPSERLTPAVAPAAAGQFVGSASCRECHQDIYDRWKGTLMANVLQDVKANPAAILADFSKPNPLVSFTRDDITHTYGSKWKQRYYKRIGNDFIVLPAQWDVQNRQWRPYYVKAGTDWWTAFYPPEQERRPTGALCDGCHSVNYDIATKTVTDWNVGCERCHGAGGAHLAEPIDGNIVNPAKLDHVRADDVCIQCHSQGKPRRLPIEGVYYDWPVGYQPGDLLADVWQFEEHHLGKETFTHWPDGTAHKNRMQGNDYVHSLMYVKGVTCYGCHDVHGTEHEADLRLPGNAVCTQCHTSALQPGPPGSLEHHTRHKPESEGSRCVACHMPAIEQTIGDVMVRSHTFRFVSPARTETDGMPNPCTSCHKDKTNEWALDELRRWPSTSPWRVSN